jgi:hypothetical protein
MAADYLSRSERDHGKTENLRLTARLSIDHLRITIAFRGIALVPKPQDSGLVLQRLASLGWPWPKTVR